MGYAAKMTNADAVPVIDITPLRDGSNPKQVADALHAASKGLGFIYIKGHGIPDQVIRKARAEALSFFRAPLKDKESVKISEQHRGWIGEGGAKMQDDLKSDLKESFVWGFEMDLNSPDSDGHSLRGKNKWPRFVPALEKASLEYFKYSHEVAHHLMRGFAIGLDLEEDFFLKTADKPISRCSYVYYPPQTSESDKQQFGVGPHTDFGVLTVLCQDSVGGLQVENVDGDWIQAPPIEGSLIVNVADLLARWTDGAYKSTPHRVINTSSKERLSLVLSFDPNPETVINAQQVFGPDHVAKEEPTTCGEYLDWRFGKAFAHRNKA